MKHGYSSLRCGLIGEHLGHSFSVMIHELLGDYSFVLRELAPSELEAFVKSDELDAYCVTIPYKKAVMPFLDVISPEAQAIGAVNVVVNGKDGKYLAHTLNNTVVAPPRMLIAFLENNLCEDGSVKIPVALRPYMGGKEKLIPKQ